MTEPATTPPPDKQEDLRTAMARRAQRVLAEPPKAAPAPPPASAPTTAPARSVRAPRRASPKSSPKDAFNDIASTAPHTPTSAMNAKFAALVEVSDLMALGRLPNHRFKSASIYDQEISFYHRIFRHQGLPGKGAGLAASQMEIDENTHLLDRPRVFQAWAELHNLPHLEAIEFAHFMTDDVKTAHLLRGGAGVTGYIRGLGRKISNAFGGGGYDF